MNKKIYTTLLNHFSYSKIEPLCTFILHNSYSFKIIQNRNVHEIQIDCERSGSLNKHAKNEPS